MKKLIVFSVVFFSGLFILLAGPPSVSAQCTYPNGCYDCQWRDVAGRYACRAVNVRCASGYTHDSDRCGQLTPQGEDVCEDPANQNLSCVLPSGAECTGITSGKPGICYTTTLCPEGYNEDGAYPDVCSLGGRCCVTAKCAPPDNSWCCQWVPYAGGCVPDLLFATCYPEYDVPKPDAYNYCQGFDINSCDYAPPQLCVFVGSCDSLGGTCRPMDLRRGCPWGEISRGRLDCELGELCCVSDLPGLEQKLFCDDRGQPTDSSTGVLYTAIGCLPVERINHFARFILGWGMGIAGGAAFLLIVVAGFIIITSTGDPKRLQAGKELLTSAIAGLALIIFSVFLLRLAGVDVLGILRAIFS